VTFFVGPFLLIGIIAWVAAIVLGVGSWFGMWRWTDRWALASGLAGLGAFELYLYAHSGMLPVLVPTANSVVVATAGLFVGCGLALGYGTLFNPAQLGRPRIPEGSAEETLWLLDAVDRLRPEPLDWALTAGMLVPCVGMIYLGLNIVGGPGLAIAGGVAMLGPIYAGVGLWLRARSAGYFALELADRQDDPTAALPETGSAPDAAPDPVTDPAHA